MRVLRAFSENKLPDEPALDAPGWWRRSDRFVALPFVHNSEPSPGPIPIRNPRRILIIGAKGTLGQAFVRLCELRGLPYTALSRNELDAADRRSVFSTISALRPWAVVNAAGFVKVDDAELMNEACFRDNESAADLLAAACSEFNASLLSFSTDLVFNGEKRTPYIESDMVDPLNAYGASKVAAELKILSTCDAALVIRCSAFFGPWDSHNFARCVWRALRDGLSVKAADDVTISPTYVPELVNAALDLLIDHETGLWHLSNDTALTWAAFARETASECGYNPGSIDLVPHTELRWAARRPLYSALGSERGSILGDLGAAIGSFARSRVEDVRCALP